MSQARDGAIALQFMMIRDLAESALPLAGNQKMVDVLAEIRRMADEGAEALGSGIVAEALDPEAPRH